MNRAVIVVLLFAGCGNKESAPPAAGSAGSGAPAAPAAPRVYEDFPVAVGPCRFVDIKDVSEILHEQMQYLGPEPDDVACHLVPAIGHSTSRAPRQVTADEAQKEVPDLFVALQDPANADWSGKAVPGLGEKAGWTADRLQVLQSGKLLRIVVVDPSLAPDVLEARVVEVGRKIAARVASSSAAEPAGSAR